ncbi:hypothetical protein [Micromonospora sp. CB01531]|uniref:hypothetical protein n=1 Tax=Micromonospora sp. CB01531 TaxID=1718947 RepID=UPI00093F21BB|nr:hypothetical protein [Micromonospora sp. CB01531]OKI61263.1 hypothetical protein A6A27_28500 [Micromonospora sp. CB01531]
MALVRVRFVGGPAHDLVRELPAEPDGEPPRRWIMRHPGEPAAPPGDETDHLYERDRRDGWGTWTMRYVRTEPFGATE